MGETCETTRCSDPLPAPCRQLTALTHHRHARPSAQAAVLSNAHKYAAGCLSNACCLVQYNSCWHGFCREMLMPAACGPAYQQHLMLPACRAAEDQPGVDDGQLQGPPQLHFGGRGEPPAHPAFQQQAASVLQASALPSPSHASPDVTSTHAACSHQPINFTVQP